MKLNYTMRIKKTIAVLLHGLFLLLAVASITVLYLNTQIGDGFSWVFRQDYEDSAQFSRQFQEDVDHIFQYVSYRDIFETDGALDLSKEMFTVSHGDGPQITYTLEEVLRYAKSQGFYLNDSFEVVNDLFIYDNASTARDQRVVWRAYNPDITLSEPGDAYSSLLELSREVLECLSQYYIVHYRLMSNPSNFYFRVSYLDSMLDDLIYTNADELSQEELLKKGAFCMLSSDSIFIDSNLKQPPANIAVSLENGNQYDASSYYAVFAVDTQYPADDVYAAQSLSFYQLRGRCLEALLGLAAGCLGCLITLYYLILVSGYPTEERVNPYLHGFDLITAESCVMMTGLCTLFALFLNEKIGHRLIHLLVTEDSWAFAERISSAVVIYTCCMTGAFSLLRRYKSRQLWSNSMICKTYTQIREYFCHRSFSHRLFCLYLAFVLLQSAGVVALAMLFLLLSGSQALLAAAALLLTLIVFDYLVFRRLFISALQKDRIADAIARIADGDTSYQMELDGLTDKELMMGQMINRIGTGLEQALQEQVRSERLKADLITNVSHDLKTPLTSIISYVDLLKRQNLPGEKVQEYLNVLDQKSQRLKTLTEDLVEASKASSGNVKLEMTTIDLVEMIWQTNGEFEEKFSQRSLTLRSQLPETSAFIRADGRQLWRVLENLYNNACKYALEHSRVYTEVEQTEDTVFFTIKNVSEMPPNVSPNELTERFVRGDVSRSTEGSGLGLSIAESLTRLQGGTFQISIDGDLFKVSISFPAWKPE